MSFNQFDGMGSYWISNTLDGIFQMGWSGAKGDKGDKGDVGSQGPIGPQGLVGDTGSASTVIGPTGESIIGPTGPIGLTPNIISSTYYLEPDVIGNVFGTYNLDQNYNSLLSSTTITTTTTGLIAIFSSDVLGVNKIPAGLYQLSFNAHLDADVGSATIDLFVYQYTGGITNLIGNSGVIQNIITCKISIFQNKGHYLQIYCISSSGACRSPQVGPSLSTFKGPIRFHSSPHCRG